MYLILYTILDIQMHTIVDYVTLIICEYIILIVFGCMLYDGTSSSSFILGCMQSYIIHHPHYITRRDYNIILIIIIRCIRIAMRFRIHTMVRHPHHSFLGAWNRTPSSSSPDVTTASSSFSLSQRHITVRRPPLYPRICQAHSTNEWCFERTPPGSDDM